MQCPLSRVPAWFTVAISLNFSWNDTSSTTTDTESFHTLHLFQKVSIMVYKTIQLQDQIIANQITFQLVLQTAKRWWGKKMMKEFTSSYSYIGNCCCLLESLQCRNPGLWKFAACHDVKTSFCRKYLGLKGYGGVMIGCVCTKIFVWNLNTSC